jgi:transcriptional regulator of acetoin/glycerol metabolism
MANPATAFSSLAGYDDAYSMKMPPVNVLLTGGHAATREVLARLLGDVKAPILAWYPGERLALPRDPRAGIMILHEVCLLPDDDQRRLLAWLETRPRRIQIVSTTSKPLHAHVEAGAFDDTLYFRLNTVRIDL